MLNWTIVLALSVICFVLFLNSFTATWDLFLKWMVKSNTPIKAQPVTAEFGLKFTPYKRNIFPVIVSLRLKSNFQGERGEVCARRLSANQSSRNILLIALQLALGPIQSVYSYFEKGCRKKCAREISKGKYGIWSIHCSLTLKLSNLLSLLSFSTRKHSPWPPVPFYPDFLWITVNLKPPTIPYGIVACTLSHNLSRNSCILQWFIRPAKPLTNHSARSNWEMY